MWLSLPGTFVLDKLVHARLEGGAQLVGKILGYVACLGMGVAIPLTASAAVILLPFTPTEDPTKAAVVVGGEVFTSTPARLARAPTLNCVLALCIGFIIAAMVGCMCGCTR